MCFVMLTFLHKISFPTNVQIDVNKVKSSSSFIISTLLYISLDAKMKSWKTNRKISKYKTRHSNHNA